MSLLFGRPRESRTISGDAFIRGLDMPMEVSRDKALRLTPVYAAVSLLADGVAALPLQAYRVGADGSRQRTGSPALFRNPSTYGTVYDWVHRAMVSLLLRGNAYGLVTSRDSSYWPTSIEWLDPDRVQVITRAGVAVYFIDGRETAAIDILHIVGFANPGSPVGLSPIEQYAMTLDMGLSAQKSARDWFKNGQTPSADITISTDGDPVGEQVARAFKDRYLASMRSGEPFVHGDNIALAPVGVSAADAQFLEAIKASATQVAAIYHVAPEDIGGERGSSLTYSTTELDEIKFQTRSLRPWVTRLEQAFGRITPRPVYMRFNFDANIRTEVKARWETHQIALATGATTINEVRQLEDRPPVPWGETPWTPPNKAAAAGGTP